jgi:hypothetical protein
MEMPKPKIRLQHFIACSNILWEGLPGPKTSRTLEGVNHRVSFPPDTEPPLVIKYLWFYARLFRVNREIGTLRFRLEIQWYDHPNGEETYQHWDLDPVIIRGNGGVVNVAWLVRDLSLPGWGWYGFKLLLIRKRFGVEHHVFLREDFLLLET